MHRKMNVLLAGLMLMVGTTLSLPNTVEAQPGITRVALVVGVGTTQTLNLHLNVQSDQFPPPNSGGLNHSLFITIQPGGVLPGGAPCRQTIHVQVDVTPGLLNTVSLGIRSGEEEKELLVNGVFEEILDDCFDETNRVVYVVGDLNDFQFPDPLPAGSVGSVNNFGGGLTLYDVTNPGGGTAASGPAGGIFTITATFRNNVVGLGLGEGAEFYYGEKPSQGEPQGPPLTPGDTATFTIVVTNTGDATCTQTIQIEELEIAHEFLIVHSISKGFGVVSFDDGDPVELEDACFKDPQHQRVVIQVGGSRPGRAQQQDSGFDSELGVQLVWSYGWTIFGLNGETKTSHFTPNGQRVLVVNQGSTFD
jgi:hypothetical protein